MMPTLFQDFQLPPNSTAKIHTKKEHLKKK